MMTRLAVSLLTLTILAPLTGCAESDHSQVLPVTGEGSESRQADRSGASKAAPEASPKNIPMH